jgi:ADP-ribose pyrophosphatase YjhB (NUDIX family)
MNGTDLLEEIKRIKTIADIGLLYHTSEYDKERYLELQQISLRLLNNVTGNAIEDLQKSFPIANDYPTAKVDIRGIILSAEKKILLVQESSDGNWSLPGGWGEIGHSPAETVIKEFKEETGIDVIPKRLLAIFDKRKHAHPPQPSYVYKMVFYCEVISATLQKGFDVLDVQYFSIDALPELSENRILKSQIELVYRKIINGDTEAFFD